MVSHGFRDALGLGKTHHYYTVCLIVVKYEENMVSHGFRDALGLGKTHHYYMFRLIVVKYGENMVSNGFRDALGLLVVSGQVTLVMHSGWPHLRPYAWCA